MEELNRRAVTLGLATTAGIASSTGSEVQPAMPQIVAAGFVNDGNLVGHFGQKVQVVAPGDQPYVQVTYNPPLAQNAVVLVTPAAPVSNNTGIMKAMPTGFQVHGARTFHFVCIGT
jgi:hypothetical protein